MRNGDSPISRARLATSWAPSAAGAIAKGYIRRRARAVPNLPIVFEGLRPRFTSGAAFSWRCVRTGEGPFC